MGSSAASATPVVQGFNTALPHNVLAAGQAVPVADSNANAMPTPSAWPAEIVDSMAWSAQFFGTVQQKK